MIEADPEIAGLLQPLRGRLELRPTLGTMRERPRVDQALMRLHGGHMDIAEERDPVRR